ncbi:MAG: hypothetical protein HOE90_24640 [Bacteriovoracaceae bacterium]|jgi:hypothetical protein|nr:hypothetical protein [Bacteriovoracaceae bacterium]
MKVLIVVLSLMMAVGAFAKGDRDGSMTKKGDRDSSIKKRGNGNDDLEGPKEIRGGGVKTKGTGDV